MTTNVDVVSNREPQQQQRSGDNGVSQVVRYKPESLSVSFQSVTIPKMRRIKQGGPRITEELLTRTSWVNAEVAYKQVQKGKLLGNNCALWLRWHLQLHLYNLGCFIQRHCGKVLFVGLLLLSMCCVGLKAVALETNVEQLWVEDGGRLEKELAYTKAVLGEGSGTTSELIIQSSDSHHNLLTVDSLLLHHKAVLKATQVTVSMYDKTWSFRDLCYASNFPLLEVGIMDSMLEKLLPCVIITPLDCFWEGSKLLGPDNGVHPSHLFEFSGPVTWANLNPMKFLEGLKGLEGYIPVQALRDVFERAGITTAYQEKPCLNPHDPECPETAPNKDSKQVPDVGGALTGGCRGFATKYMHWQEDLIVGGITRNKTQHIVGAEAFQSIIQLMGEQEVYEFHMETKKVNRMRWTSTVAKNILTAWQRKFTQEVERVMALEVEDENATTTDNVYPFSSTSLMDLLVEFSKMSTVRVVLGYVLMLFYACVSLMRWTDPIRSQSGIGIAGVLLIALSVAAGLGICCVLGIKFNASTTQVVPFLALGLGVDDMFLIAHTFAEFALKDDIPYSEQTGECLKQTGISVLLTSLSNVSAFFMAAVIPIPALRAFVLQAAILIIFNMLSILLVYPAIVSLDLMRREEKRVDVFCCFTGSLSSDNKVIELQPQSSHQRWTPPPEYRERTPPPPYTNNFMVQSSHDNPMVHTISRTHSDGSNPQTMVAPPELQRTVSWNQVCPSSSLPPSNASSHQCLASEKGLSCVDRCAQTQRECCSWSLSWFARNIYAPFLQKTPAKMLVLVLFAVLLVLGIVGTTRVRDGLLLTDVVPRDTNEYKFLQTQSKYFGFYYFYAVVKEDFDIANNQKLLYDYHQSFQRVDRIIKKEDGTIPDFWLTVMRTWLLDVQEAFGKDWEQGRIHRDGWYDNATDEGVIGYKLLLQTGNIETPIDKDRVPNKRLVNKDNIIDPSAFYNYLTAWTSIDALAYHASQANFHPLPEELIDFRSQDSTIRKSHVLEYSQLAFFLNDMVQTEDIVETVQEIRGICEAFSDQGLPNYPSGIPFTFWEQYLNLRFYLMLALICVLAGIFLVLSLVLMNPWAAVIVVVVLTMMVVELFGFMGLAGLKLSAVPAVILIVSVGIGVEFTVHICLGFLTAVGSRNRRMSIALEHMFAPVIHGAVTTLLGVIMLAGAEFDFIVKYFFVVLTVLILLGVLNGLVLLPVLLSLIGPAAEVIAPDGSDRIPVPSPEPSPRVPRRTFHTSSSSRRIHPRIPSDISLSTITEEPTQYSSHEIIVQPEVVVETTLPGATSSIIHQPHSTDNFPINNNSSSSSSSSAPSSSTSTPPNTHVTRVKATTKVKVEVHTPLPGSVQHEYNYKSKKRKHKEAAVSSSDSESYA